MQPSDQPTGNIGGSIDLSVERRLQATQLLSEALKLLGGEPQVTLAKPPPNRLLRLAEVQQLTGLCRSAIYEQMRCGSFPRSVKASTRTATWSESDVQAWIADRIGPS